MDYHHGNEPFWANKKPGRRVLLRWKLIRPFVLRKYRQYKVIPPPAVTWADVIHGGFGRNGE